MGLFNTCFLKYVDTMLISFSPFLYTKSQSLKNIDDIRLFILSLTTNLNYY
jgi:hypothetical protein